MELTGRIVSNAQIATLKDDRQVINFTIAINDQYTKKGGGERKQLTTYYNCAYWISTKVALLLTKGTLVELSGRVYATAYMSSNNEAKASLHVHVNTIKLHGRSVKKEEVAEVPQEATITNDGLPF